VAYTFPDALPPQRAKGNQPTVHERGTWGVRNIRESLLPRFEFTWGMELDTSEQVLSSTRSLWFGDKATLFECLSFVMQEVDDVVEDFLWEIRLRHHGSSHEVLLF